MYVRYETGNGDGLFRIYVDFEDLVRSRIIRTPKKRLREIEALYFWLKENVEPAPVEAYQDRLSRRPVTWLKSSAVEHVRVADRLVGLLNKEGLNIRRVAARDVPRILWEDEVQAITRAGRRPKSVQAGFPDARFARRQVRQRRRRMGAARRKTRSMRRGE